MRNKKHPEAYVDIYVDGRVHVTPVDTLKGFRDTVKINLIEDFVTKAKARLGDDLEPGRYKVTITSCRLFPKPDLSFDLQSV